MTVCKCAIPFPEYSLDLHRKVSAAESLPSGKDHRLYNAWIRGEPTPPCRMLASIIRRLEWK